jgi:hypothetical protein
LYSDFDHHAVRHHKRKMVDNDCWNLRPRLQNFLRSDSKIWQQQLLPLLQQRDSLETPEEDERKKTLRDPTLIATFAAAVAAILLTVSLMGDDSLSYWKVIDFASFHHAGSWPWFWVEVVRWLHSIQTNEPNRLMADDFRSATIQRWSY